MAHCTVNCRNWMIHCPSNTECMVWYGKILFIVVFNHVAAQCPSIASERHNHNMLIYSQHCNYIYIYIKQNNNNSNKKYKKDNFLSNYEWNLHLYTHSAGHHMVIKHQPSSTAPQSQ